MEKPAVKPIRFVKGNMVSTDLAAARRFYEDMLGLECVQTAKDTMLVRDRGAQGEGRRAGEHYWVIEVREVEQVSHPQRVLHHWGLDLAAKEDVDRVHQRLEHHREAYGIRTLYKPQFQHGSYAFYLQDRDFNWWEFQFVPPSRSRRNLIARGDVVPD